MPTTKKERYQIGMAGEFLVAAQLLRQGIMASVTYGNAKCADVIASNTSAEGETKAVVIQVKTSLKQRWPVGNRVPMASSAIWVFVEMPKDATEGPSFYVMTQKEIHEALDPVQTAYEERYQNNHGEPYGDRPGVAAMTLKLARAHKNQWDKVKELLKLSSDGSTSRP